MQGQIFNLEVNPRVPAALERLPELAMNLRFTWHRPTRALFASLDRRLFLDLHSNPKLFLRCVDQRRLDQAAADPAFLEEYQRVLARLDAYQERSERFHGETLPATDLVAYFCAEFGFHESLPMYSGGLGVLAGDHCKTASDLNMNFVGVGLLYRRGYFTQEIDNAGQQHSVFKDIDHEDLPVELLRDAAGAPLEIAIPVADRTVWAQLWQAQVGRVPVYLLDANVARNSESDRHITHALYAGDHDRRIQQELVLGIGGVRALRALGLAPSVWHINEGHAAFLTLELTAELVEQGLDIDTAKEAAAAGVVFTTHTPVAAGHDAFDPPMVAGYCRDYIRRLGLDEAGFAALGRGADGRFNMTRLAINLSRHHNGVSRLHGEISARICADAWPEVPAEDNPMGYVTNGVHVPTFLFQYWKDLFDMSLGEAWRTREDDPAFWTRLAQIPDEIFIDIKRAVKAEMMRAVQIRLERVCTRNGVGESHLARMTRFLNPDSPSPLVIGFARRFATYKRAALLLRDLTWLKQIACHPERPVVFVFAGKAHPQDVPAQQLIREVVGAAGDPELVGHVVFVEDYDMGLARSLIAGVDVWLNTPVSPLEASGTSGIKAAINGTLNLSVLDGWWAEGHAADNGWALPPSRAADPGRRDAEDAQALYELLQDTVVPMYYARDERGVPREWVRRMKQSIMTILPAFNMRRVLRDYADGSYGPAASAAHLLAADGHAAAHALATWKRRVRAAWPGVRAQVLTAPATHVAFDGRVQARVAVHTGGLGPDDLRVELLLSRLVPDGTSEQPRLTSHRGALAPIRVRNGHATACVPLACTGERLEDGGWVFATDGAPPWCGKLQAALRVTPHHRLLAHPYELGLMRWL